MLNHLPRELIFTILMFLSASDLVRVAQSSHEFKEWGDDEGLWRRLCWYCFGGITKEKDRTWKETFIEYDKRPHFVAWGSTLQVLERGERVKVKAQGWPGYKTALASRSSSSGVHFWRVQLRPQLPGWLAIIGVINEAMDKPSLEVPFCEMIGSYSFFYDGKLMKRGPHSCRLTQGTGYSPGDIVMVYLDLDAMTLSFYLQSSNKVSHVTTYHQIEPGQYRLAVSLNYQGTEVLLLDKTPVPEEVTPYRLRGTQWNP